MFAHMTNGTAEFLQKIIDKHPEKHISLMHGESSSLAYYEDKAKSIFNSGREYVILITIGAVQEEGYVVMNNIPVTEEGQPVFEHHFQNRKHEVEKMPGFQAFRLLKPKKGNTYIVFTQWRSVQDFENWKTSDQFKQAHKNPSVKTPDYYADRPFITSYHMVTEEK
ncbi:Heme-degrading monooxygenase HmoA [Virgibacillus chiguensis]|uniref:Heme-degrading monooxygenase HmoA n=2 Tax=Virgibacillus chiguensis TaxID=411959 RepID=A0A1M5PUS0_9BACI|nr:Heme-degrading monooxygenase HmoA [Virgibacillus chiguensis]